MQNIFFNLSLSKAKLTPTYRAAVSDGGTVIVIRSKNFINIKEDCMFSNSSSLGIRTK
jgi:hypothetical protein